jgi:class 3 adenylate cyclase/predicted ATPase
MRCPICSFENPEGGKFCEDCGKPLVAACPKCGREARPNAKFCSECGASLTERLAAAVAARSRDGVGDHDVKPDIEKAASAERRQLTVMFCDLVGSTALSTQIDPEELREVVEHYQDACERVVHDFDGYIARYVGDALLVYFGYPVAHEDDPVRAIKAALGIRERIQALNTTLRVTVPVLSASPLQVRIGIHTGLVVVGEMGGKDYRESMALGDTPNISARLQGIAEPDTVVISAATYRLAQGQFECEDMGPQMLKGAAAPVKAYRVVADKVEQSRFEVAVKEGLSPLIGREDELGLLLKRWSKAKEGEGQVVLIGGEAGIGKSHLVQTLKEQIAPDNATHVEFRCSPYHQNSAFFPLITHLQRFLQFGPHDTPADKVAKLSAALAKQRFASSESLPLLAAFLSLPQPDGVQPLILSPQKQKQKVQETLVAWLLEEAERRPMYCAWEDLHWADPSSLDVLTVFLEQVPNARVLTILAFRPDFVPPWRPRSHMIHITLGRLGRRSVETIVENLTRGKALPPDVLQQIVSKTDGVPLFVEELTKTVVESGLVRESDGQYTLVGPLPPLAIPATLQDSLMARLDRLAPVKEIAQLGATLGREFSHDVLQAVSPLSETELREGLRQLLDAEMLHQRGQPPHATYSFKHALIRDAAYQSLLKSKRQRLHQQIAEVLEEKFPEAKETNPELVAHHYTAAGLVAQAIPHWQRAGQRALQRSANIEAIAHLTKGLELLRTLPETPERARDEVALQITLGTSLVMIKGYAAPEVERAYTRARELCAQVGETTQLFPAVWGLWVFYFVQGNLRMGRDLGEQLLHLAENSADVALRLEAHLALGAVLLRRGEPASAREHLERGISLYDQRLHGSHAFIYGQDPKVACLSDAAYTLWLLGYPDQAVQRNREALALARELGHSFSLAFALSFATWLQQFCREAEATRESAEATIHLSTEEGFPNWLGIARVLQGWAVAEQGLREEGIEFMQQGWPIIQATGAALTTPYCLSLLADVYWKGNRLDEAMNMLREALTYAHSSGECWWEAELHRLRGELLLTQSGTPTAGSGAAANGKDAESCFLTALAIARAQRAKSLELRAATSIARLWRRQGRALEARELLAGTYGWFTEGFATKDLLEARVLLDELTA